MSDATTHEKPWPEDLMNRYSLTPHAAKAGHAKC
jgi:hypothetical protein